MTQETKEKRKAINKIKKADRKLPSHVKERRREAVLAAIAGAQGIRFNIVLKPLK